MNTLGQPTQSQAPGQMCDTLAIFKTASVGQLAGFRLFTQVEWRVYDEGVASARYPYRYFLTKKEWIRFDNSADVLGNITLRSVTSDQARALQALLGLSFGVFPDPAARDVADHR